jgi:hypothetical protein
MSRDFNSSNFFRSSKSRVFYRYKWDTEAYSGVEESGLPNIINNLFVERMHYGLIDHENNSVIPNEDFLVSTDSGRVFDFVADSYSLMRLNFRTALERGIVSNEGSAFGNLSMVSSYTNPRLKYGRYLKRYLPILQRNTHTKQSWYNQYSIL